MAIFLGPIIVAILALGIDCVAKVEGNEDLVRKDVIKLYILSLITALVLVVIKVTQP